uniref:Ketoreductase domain-containing protein n=1 Tax=Clastoptera arizonana TaxID=38151 RepID=A0A1B6DEX8_9HEMI
MFSGKVVLITGSSSGIGAGAAVHFSKLGANVVITGRKSDKLKNVSEQCERVGHKPLTVVGDISDYTFLDRLLKETIETYKRLDVLVNNAGIGSKGSLLTTTMADYEYTLRVNVHSVFYLTKLAMPHLIQTRGNVVNVSSAASKVPVPAILAYSMSKAAMDHFSRIVSLEMASRGVRVNVVNPGPIYTDIGVNSGATEEQVAQSYEIFAKMNPLKRVGTVEETATAIAFLASEECASYITGVCLEVDGGQRLMCVMAD